MLTDTAAVPHNSNWPTYEHRTKVGRTAYKVFFFAPNAAAAEVYAERCNADMRGVTNSKVRTVSLKRAIG